MAAKLHDITGQRFERLTVLRRVTTNSPRHPKWECRCDCGNTALVAATSLLIGHSRSCGCLRAETTRARSKQHGMCRTRVYNIWSGMITRCTNPKVQCFAVYGARGISVCERWRDFNAFFADMGYPPSANHSIDRINTNGNYSPENCRWALKRIQANNTRTNRFVTYRGESKTLADWSHDLGIPYRGLQHRLDRGWDVNEAFEKPFRGQGLPVRYRDV